MTLIISAINMPENMEVLPAAATVTYMLPFHKKDTGLLLTTTLTIKKKPLSDHNLR